jgi:hypothetical protein
MGDIGITYSVVCIILQCIIKFIELLGYESSFRIIIFGDIGHIYVSNIYNPI